MKVPCIPIYSLVEQNHHEIQFSTINPSAPSIFRYCILTGIDITVVLPLTTAEIKEILQQGYVDAPPFAKNTPPYRIELDYETTNRLNALCQGKEDTDYIFSFQKGTMPSRSGFQRMLQRAAAIIMPQDADLITIYSLKKTFAFRMYQKNDSIAETLHITGHQSPSRLQDFLGISSTSPGNATSRDNLLNANYGIHMINEIRSQLDDLERELYNPRNPDAFFREAEKNLSAFTKFLGIVSRK